MRQKPSDAVGGAVDLFCEVFVEPDEHRELSGRLIVCSERPQRMRHGAGSVGDDGGVAGIGLGLTRWQVRDVAHRQAGEVADTDSFVSSDSQRQSADGGRLVYDEQDAAQGFQALDELTQPGLVLRQGFVEDPMPAGRQRHRVMMRLSHIDSDEDVDYGIGQVVVHVSSPLLIASRWSA